MTQRHQERQTRNEGGEWARQQHHEDRGRVGEAHREMGKGERSHCEPEARTAGDPSRELPSFLGTPPPSANCGKEGVQVESTTTQRTQNQEVGEQGAQP